MPSFTEAQLQELEALYGLVRVEPAPDTRPVRDGRIAKGDMVWWRNEGGPEFVDSADLNHWLNLTDHPQCYQIREPITQLRYLD